MNREVICGIYKIESPSGKIYIGQSENIYRRWHLYHGKHVVNELKSSEVYPTILRRSIRKYGCDKLIFSIVEICEKEKLNEIEIFWIEFYDTFNTAHGMNCTKGGGGIRGYKLSKEACLKISIRNKGMKAWNTGIKSTPEHKEKNSKGGKSSWQRRKASKEYYSEEQKARRSRPNPKNGIIHKQWWKNKKESSDYYSIEEKQKRGVVAILREQKKKENGFKVSDETIEKNRLASLKMWEKRRSEGRDKFTGEALENIRKAHIKRIEQNRNDPTYNTPTEIRKRREVVQSAWENKRNGVEYNSEEQVAKRKASAQKTIATKKANGYKLTDAARLNMSIAAKKINKINNIWASKNKIK